MSETLLIVDDDEMLRVQLSRAMANRGFEVSTASNYDEAVDVLEAFKPDYAVVDLKMPGESGLVVLKSLRQQSPGTRAVVMTGYGSIANAVEAMRLGAVNYVTKPADADQIMGALRGDVSCAQADFEGSDAKRPSLAELEWNHIQKVLADCDSNITHAAKILDIPRRTLQRKLKKRAP